MGFFSFLFGPKTDFKTLIKQGAIVVDVRSVQEYAGGHIQGSLNIPLQNLGSQLAKLPKDKVVITCCASGIRSASATSILTKAGYSAYNGGSWVGLQQKIG